MLVRLTDERIWAGRRHAAELMPGLPKELLADKSYRVATCEKLRELGENQCQSA